MKGITKDCLSLQYERSMQKKIRITSQAIHFQFPSTGRQFPAFMIYWPHLNCLVKSPTFKILFKKSPAFTSALIISRYDIIFYMHTQYVFTQII